jgi:hypothetical protein
VSGPGAKPTSAGGGYNNNVVDRLQQLQPIHQVNDSVAFE